jgi:hypothetical protein
MFFPQFYLLLIVCIRSVLILRGRTLRLMLYTDSFKARGHVNVRLTHRNTIMTTTEHSLTTKGDCIAAVLTEKSIRDLNLDLRTAAKSSDAEIKLVFAAGEESVTITGRGHPDLSFTHPLDIVTRTSSYICPRTLMIHADKASKDLPRVFVKQLQKPETVIQVTVMVKTLEH